MITTNSYCCSLNATKKSKVHQNHSYFPQQTLKQYFKKTCSLYYCFKVVFVGVGVGVLINNDGELQCFCFLLRLSPEPRERDDWIRGGGGLEDDEEEGANLLDWLLSFFFPASLTLFISPTLVSCKPAGSTHLQSTPVHQCQRCNYSPSILLNLKQHINLLIRRIIHFVPIVMHLMGGLNRI